MSGFPWRGGINTILYVLIYAGQLDEQQVARVADMIIEQRALPGGPAPYLQAIEDALASGDEVSSGIDTPHSEQEFRDFLTRLADRLKQSRPWPEPKLTKVDIGQWDTLSDARPIAKIDLSSFNVGQRIPEQFDRLPLGDGTLAGLMLRLRSGAVLGLLAPADGRTPGVTVLLRDGDPDAVIDEFLSYTSVPPDSVRRLG